MGYFFGDFEGNIFAVGYGRAREAGGSGGKQWQLQRKSVYNDEMCIRRTKLDLRLKAGMKYEASGIDSGRRACCSPAERGACGCWLADISSTAT